MSSFEQVMEERKKLVEKIIENMKQGYVLPKPDWNQAAFMDTRISNPVSGARYHGSNLLRLYLAGLEKGYIDGRWMTYKQAQSEGWQVRKGEQGVRCEKYIFTRQIEEENPDTGELEKKKVPLSKPMVNTFVVFNAQQIEGIPACANEPIEPLQPDEILDMAEMFRESSLCPIRETNEGRAYYAPGRDEIVLPNRNVFLDTQSFLATQLHEMVHSTGHPDRLNRPLTGRFGSPGYAMEELRAELGSFFIQNDLNLHFDAQHFNSHTKYLESWIGTLKKDPNELFRAIADAQKASDFLEERYERFRDRKMVLSEERNDLVLSNSLNVYPVDLSKNEASAIRMAVKRELKNAGRGKMHFDNWIKVQQQREFPLQPERAAQLQKAFYLAMEISKESSVEAVMLKMEEQAKLSGSDFSDEVATIKGIYDFQDNKGFQFNCNCTAKEKNMPVKSCSR